MSTPCLGAGLPFVAAMAFLVGYTPVTAVAETAVPSEQQGKGNQASKVPIRWSDALAFSPDGTLVAVAEYLPSLFDRVTGKKLADGRPDGEPVGFCLHIAFDSDGRRMVSVHRGMEKNQPYLSVFVWEIKPGNQLGPPIRFLAKNHETRKYPTEVYQASFSPDGRSVIAGSADGTVYVWECATRGERYRFQGGVAAVFSPDGRTLLVLAHDGLVRRFDALTGLPLNDQKPSVRTDFIYTGTAAFAANAERVAVSDGNEVLLIESTTGKRICRLDFPEGCHGMALSPDSRTLAVSVGKDGICLLDAGTGKEKGWHRCSPAYYGRKHLAFTADGKTLAWSADGALETHDYAELLAGSLRRPAFASSEPAGMQLQAELVSRQDRYALDLGEQSAEEFSRSMNSARAGPGVDLELRIRNTGTEPLTIFPKLKPGLYLTGAGAMNIYWSGQSAGFPGRAPQPVRLIPGATHAIRVTELVHSGGRSYWLLPGEYAIHATYSVQVTPAPKGTEKDDDNSAWVELRSPPLKVKVDSH